MMPSLAQLGFHFVLSRHGIMTSMRQILLVLGKHFCEHTPSFGPHLDLYMSLNTHSTLGIKVSTLSMNFGVRPSGKV